MRKHSWYDGELTLFKPEKMQTRDGQMQLGMGNGSRIRWTIALQWDRRAVGQSSL